VKKAAKSQPGKKNNTPVEPAAESKQESEDTLVKPVGASGDASKGSEMSGKEVSKEAPDQVPKMYFSAAGRVLPRTVLLRESEKPSDNQLARIMEGKGSDFDEMCPIKWNIGDVVWGHVSGHPWWPGMVSSDPFSGLFTTLTAGARVSRQYFVQYFGDEAERAWVRESSCMAFEGKQAFQEMGDSQIKVTKKNKLIQAFVPNQRRKAPWYLAVDEAEDARGLGREERIDKYTFIYEFVPNKRPPKTPNTPTPASTSSPATTTDKRGVKRKEPECDDSGEETDDYEEASAPKRQRKDVNTPVSRSRGREEGSFETYCIKHREAVREEHPDYNGGMVIEALKQQWALMTPQQRLKYKSKFAPVSTPTPAEPMDEDPLQGQ
jgi:hypothetical protein